MKRFLLITLPALFILAGCSGGMNIQDFSDEKPTLILEEYFAGDTRAWGVFHDRSGKLRRSFTVDIEGERTGNQIILTEDFVYNDGEEDQRIWTITRESPGVYSGTASDVVGTAKGVQAGNSLQWQYNLLLPVGDNIYKVHFNDWMHLQPDDVLINQAKVTKWGFRVGTVTLFFKKNDL